MDIPQYYQNIFKGYTQKLLANFTRNCNICHGTGYHLIDGDMFRDCDCIKNFNRLKKYTNIGINVKHIGREMSWFKNEFSDNTYNKIKEIETNLDEALKVNFIIYPANNNMWGASHIGNQIIKFCVDKDKQCAVASSKNVMDLFFSWDKPELQECIEYLQWVDVLLIDDFGTEYNSKMKENNSFVSNSFNGFLMERKRANKATIIASNFHIKYLKETYSTEIQNVITTNFVGLKINSKTQKKTEFDGMLVKLQQPTLKCCFDDLESIEVTSKSKRKSVF